MEKTIQNIVQYVKTATIQYPDIEKLEKKVLIIKNFYKDIDDIYNKRKPPLTPLTDSQKKLFDEINSIKMFENYSNYIIKKEIFVENIAQLSFNRMYPTIIKLYTLNNIYNETSYSFMVEHFNEIKNQLNIDEIKIFRFIINYKYGIISKFNLLLDDYVRNFCKKMMIKILSLDELVDIVYIDIDVIYFYYNEKLYNKILIFNELFDFEIEKNKIIYFIDKKRYIEFKDMSKVKIRGMIFSDFYKNKDIKNLSYRLYKKDGGKLKYVEFMNYTTNKQIKQKYFSIAKQIITRQKKLKRINF